MSEPLADDTQYREIAVVKVEGSREKGWWITDEEGWSLGVDGDSPVEPRAGMIARMYGRGIGHEVRGLTLDGAVVRYRSPAEQEAKDAERRREYDAERARVKLEPTCPDPQIENFEWSEDMREISGFGGGYERLCRKMVSQGCKWWSEHPDADPKFRGFKGIYGVITDENDDAKALEKAVMEGADDCTGAMHQAAISHVFLWRREGSWLAYQQKMRELRREEKPE